MDKLIVLIFAVICGIVCNSDAAKIKCTAAELEKHLAPLLGAFGMKEIKFPENKSELSESCRVQNIAERKVKEYSTHCLSEVIQSVMSVVLYTAHRMNKQYCTKLRKTALEMGPCGNRAKDDTTKCWNKLINDIYAIKSISDPKLKIPLVCCTFHNWKDCTVDAYESLGPPHCTDSAVTALDERISTGSFDAYNVVCQAYNDYSDKCDKLIEYLPEISDKPDRSYKTPFMYLFEIYDTI